MRTLKSSKYNDYNYYIEEVTILRNRRRDTHEVAIACNQNELIAMTECLQLLNAQNLITSNDVVVITPNWVNENSAITGQVVGPESLRGLIRFVKQASPKRLVVASGSGEKETPVIMEACGFAQVIKDEDVEFIDLNHGPFVELTLNHPVIPKTKINQLINEMTFLISFTQLKYHEEATMSAAIKNIGMGWPPAEEHGFPKKNTGIHKDLNGFVSAFAEQVPIDLSIVSASPAMIGTGPSKGVARHTGIVLAGTDPVSVDTVGARLLGFKPQAVRYLFECANKGLGNCVLDEIELRGIPIIEAEKLFSQMAYGAEVCVDRD